MFMSKVYAGVGKLLAAFGGKFPSALVLLPLAHSTL